MISTSNPASRETTGLSGRFAATALASGGLRLRRARAEDLDAVNALIARAIESWGLPERVRRIGLPLYLYHDGDLGFLELTVVEDADGCIIGAAAWEPADARNTPRGCSAMLLHGIYVEPRWHRRGVGSRLLAAAVQAAANDRHDGLIAKAQADAIPFFEALGLERLSISKPASDYPHRFWYPTRQA